MLDSIDAYARREWMTKGFDQGLSDEDRSALGFFIRTRFSSLDRRIFEIEERLTRLESFHSDY